MVPHNRSTLSAVLLFPSLYPSLRISPEDTTSLPYRQEPAVQVVATPFFSASPGFFFFFHPSLPLVGGFCRCGCPLSELFRLIFSPVSSCPVLFVAGTFWPISQPSQSLSQKLTSFCFDLCTPLSVVPLSASVTRPGVFLAHAPEGVPSVPP